MPSAGSRTTGPTDARPGGAVPRRAISEAGPVGAPLAEAPAGPVRGRGGRGGSLRDAAPPSMLATLALDLLPGADPTGAVNALRQTPLAVMSVDAVRGFLVALVEAESPDALAAAAAVLAARPEVRDLGTDAG